MKTEISAGDKNKETGDNSSDAFEIIKRKRKSADNKETRQDDKKKKQKSTNDNVSKSSQKTNPKNDNDALKKSQISVKKEAACSGGVTTRSGASKNIKSRKGEEISDGNNSEDKVTSYTCNICEETFKNHSQYKTHKLSCTKIPKKFVCSKCSKGFTARCYLSQHFDFKHTNKPKKYYCKPCNKYFELEKTMKEHNRQLHNDGDYKYLCDFCSRGFWHLQEFKLHHAGHTGVKPYKCGQCEVASFADVHRLNHHLKTCGKLNAFECNQCGKMYSDQKSLSTHVSDTHNKTERKCALCPNVVYTLEGGYYTHMRMKHQIGRNGRKLQDVLKEQQGQETEESDEEITAMMITRNQTKERRRGMKKRNKLLKGKGLIHLIKKTHHKVRRRGVMTIKKLLNGKQLNHLIKRTHHKVKRRKQIPKIKVTKTEQVKTTRNLNQQHRMKRGHPNPHLEKRQQKLKRRIHKRWFTTVPCLNAIDSNLTMNSCILNIS